MDMGQEFERDFMVYAGRVVFYAMSKRSPDLIETIIETWLGHTKQSIQIYIDAVQQSPDRVALLNMAGISLPQFQEILETELENFIKRLKNQHEKMRAANNSDPKKIDTKK